MLKLARELEAKAKKTDTVLLLCRSDTDAALDKACALMGRFFGVSRVGYGHLDPVEDMFDYSVCWTDGRAQPLLGRVDTMSAAFEALCKPASRISVFNRPQADQGANPAIWTGTNSRARTLWLRLGASTTS